MLPHLVWLLPIDLSTGRPDACVRASLCFTWSSIVLSPHLVMTRYIYTQQESNPSACSTRPHHSPPLHIPPPHPSAAIMSRLALLLAPPSSDVRGLTDPPRPAHASSSSASSSSSPHSIWLVRRVPNVSVYRPSISWHSLRSRRAASLRRRLALVSPATAAAAVAVLVCAGVADFSRGASEGRSAVACAGVVDGAAKRWRESVRMGGRQRGAGGREVGGSGGGAW
jgi:hypothetical protein